MKLNNIIKHFRVAPIFTAKQDNLDPEYVNGEAAKRGYLVQPQCCNKMVMEFIESETWNPNSGFYKTWQEVQEKSRFELYIDQILHYLSTYGTDYQGEVYSRNGEPIDIPYNTYTVIEAVTIDELFDRLINWLKSGIATSTDLLNEMINYIDEYNRLTGKKIPVDEIKNKEAQIMICDKLGIMPTEPNALIRYMFYKVTGKPMVIKSKSLLYQLHAQFISIPEFRFTEGQLRGLATIYNRYKPFILGLKKNKGNVKWVNKVSRLAKNLHKPMKIGFWENLTNLSEAEIKNQWGANITKLDSMYKCIRLIEMIRLRRTQNTNKSSRMFTIRNGKIFIDKNSIAPFNPILNDVEEALLGSIAEALEPQAINQEAWQNGNVYVKLPSNVELMCPSSEKLFFGNLPYGSYFTFPTEDACFGVYWRNEWGTRDFDISFLDSKGYKWGWNGGYYDTKNSLVFSGDMTNADPEATEMFKVNKKCPNGYIMLNRYNGEDGSKYQLFFGKENIKNLYRNHMVNPNNILLKEEGFSTSQQQMVGIIYEGKYYPMLLNMGNSRVSISTEGYWEAIRDKSTSHLSVREVLLEAGWKIWDPESEECKQFDGPAMDLSDYSKDTLVNLFSKEL